MFGTNFEVTKITANFAAKKKIFKVMQPFAKSLVKENRNTNKK